jgi:agmatinase
MRQRQLTSPFAGIPTFLRVPLCDDLSQLDADIAVIGVPTDEGSPFLPGSRFGPRGIREHSLRLPREGYYDQRTGRSFLVAELTNDRVRDVGDVDVLPTDVAGTFDNITKFVSRVIARGALPVVLGGDHAISFPVVRAYSKPLHVVHFDAHIDYAPFRHGFEFTNAHAFRHIHHMSHVRSLTQVGIRSIRNPKTWLDDSVRDGNRVVSMEDFRTLGTPAIVDALPSGESCYVSVDIDVLDLPLVPGCVSAEPNGMTYAELRDCLTAVAERVNIIGFDLVELNPLLDIPTGITSYLAAHTIVEFLGQICAQPRWEARHSGALPPVLKD